ncbi:MAG: hypothetical protein EXR72_03210 [Myxococcales bacterium]|nr:hypothetical protein [Myxococcales bacterium]
MLQGFITESDFQAIEDTFPGIWHFYVELHDKPCTFIELLWRFSRRASACGGELALPQTG